jgi:hypothetical protein
VTEKISTLEKILENRRQKKSFGGCDTATEKISSEKKPEVKILEQEKNIPTIPVTHPQPCPVCRCPAFWVSVYDSSHAHCRVCKPEPASAVVQGYRNVILSLSESLGTNRDANQAYEWEGQDEPQADAATSNNVVDRSGLESVTTADGCEVLTVCGWNDLRSQNYSQWLILAVKHGINAADNLLTMT